MLQEVETVEDDGRISLEAAPKSIAQLMAENPDAFNFGDMDTEIAQLAPPRTSLLTMLGAAPEHPEVARILGNTGLVVVPVKLRQQRQITAIYNKQRAGAEEGQEIPEDAYFDVLIEVAKVILRDADGKAPSADKIEDSFRVEDLNILIEFANGNLPGEATPVQ